MFADGRIRNLKDLKISSREAALLPASSGPPPARLPWSEDCKVGIATVVQPVRPRQHGPAHMPRRGWQDEGSGGGRDREGEIAEWREREAEGGKREGKGRDSEGGRERERERGSVRERRCVACVDRRERGKREREKERERERERGERERNRELRVSWAKFVEHSTADLQ